MSQFQEHDDVIKWKYIPRYWPFVRGIHRSPVNSPHNGQWRRALMFSLICAWINGWVNNCDAGDLRRHRTHHDVIVMLQENHFPYGVHVKEKVQYPRFDVFCCCFCFDRCYLHSSGSIQWHWGNHTIAPVPLKGPWRIWVNISYGSITRSWWYNTTKRIKSKPRKSVAADQAVYSKQFLNLLQSFLKYHLSGISYTATENTFLIFKWPHVKKKLRAYIKRRDQAKWVRNSWTYLQFVAIWSPDLIYKRTCKKEKVINLLDNRLWARFKTSWGHTPAIFIFATKIFIVTSFVSFITYKHELRFTVGFTANFTHISILSARIC